MVNFVQKLVQFIKDVSKDTRIPERDKKVLLALLVLVISPIDLIPDWIPILGQLDDIVIISLILDYLFKVLDSDVLLSHYPWGMKSFTKLRQFSQFIALLAPRFIKRRIWSYTGNPY